MPSAGDTMLREMMTIRKRVTKRVSSWDKTGGNRDMLWFEPGAKKVIADIKGAGIVKHLYITTIDPDPLQFRKVVIRMYWDGEQNPSVEVPFGDLFGTGFCIPTPFQSLAVTLNPGHDTRNSYGFNIYLPMPFSNGAVFEVENQSDLTFGGFWFHIDYDEEKSIPDDLGRFHCQWRRENPTEAVPREKSKGVNLTGDDNYVILDAEGTGNYVGFFLNVDNLQGGWYGEGDDMIFVDGEPFPPSYHGTGSEEIFGGGACPNYAYFGPYTGFHMVSQRDWGGKQSMFRFHVLDPVCFQKSIRVTLEHGHANDLANDYSSSSFWYQHEPHGAFPKLPPMKDRLPRFPEEFWPGYQLWLDAHKYLAEGHWPEGVALEERRMLRMVRAKFYAAFLDGKWREAHETAYFFCRTVEALFGKK